MFMARANAAYYATRDPFADFTTAPEISQMFGELLGAWAAVTWRAAGALNGMALIEAGPGRGTLMQDALRAIARVAPDFRATLQLHLVETSPRLRAEQRTRLPDGTWHESLADVPPGPAILFANEFLDALPIRQFVRRTSGWQERFVAGAGFIERPAPSFRPAFAEDPPEGSVAEASDAISAWIGALAGRLAREGGAALILDYGSAASLPGDSLQALRDGAPADPLADPGAADLTAHVDFAAVARAAAAAGAMVWGPLPQGIFLDRLGLQARTARLCASCPDRAVSIRDAADRLAAPGRMGRLFKVLCLAHPDLPMPAGFA
jgi:SAM-dependent MidA family methyltransferase